VAQIDTLEAVIGGAGALTFAGFMLRKWFVSWLADKPTIANNAAIAEQFEVLTESIKANRAEIAALRLEVAALRSEVARMDATIHLQQRTITRMEMLIRQFLGLLDQSGIVVPQLMQDEIKDLLKGGVA